MGTKIEWTDETWNPVTGCTEVSPGCNHCYANTFAERWRGTAGHYFEHGFDVQLRPDKMDLPLRWRRPRRIFVNSMSDLFHDQVPDDYIAEVFAVMRGASHHTFQVLTKRHARMRTLLSSPEFVGEATRGFDRPKWPLPNVWLGVSAENQQWADIRIPALLDTPAAIRFVSAEPLLGPIELYDNGYLAPDEFYRDGIDWVIVGGESGRGARPMHPDWARSLRDQCERAAVPFLFKQWGEWAPSTWFVAGRGGGTHAVATDGRFRNLGYGEVLPERVPIKRLGKHRAGRELDGRPWDQYPQVCAHG